MGGLSQSTLAWNRASLQVSLFLMLRLMAVGQVDDAA